jgi:hypothetical protein
MRVPFEHPQRRPATDVLHDAERDAGRDHRRRARMAQDMMRHAVQADAPHQATERDADGLLARWLAFSALTEDVTY